MVVRAEMEAAGRVFRLHAVVKLEMVVRVAWVAQVVPVAWVAQVPMALVSLFTW
jgi:hypothetical protein